AGRRAHGRSDQGLGDGAGRRGFYGAGGPRRGPVGRDRRAADRSGGHADFGPGADRGDRAHADAATFETGRMTMTKMFAVTAFDRKNHFDKRMEVRPTHLKYWDDNAASMVLAGPFLGEDGKAIGSMMVVTASDLAAAEALVGNDPYA